MKACNRHCPISGLQFDYVHDWQKENKVHVIKKKNGKKNLENNYI